MAIPVILQKGHGSDLLNHYVKRTWTSKLDPCSRRRPHETRSTKYCHICLRLPAVECPYRTKAKLLNSFGCFLVSALTMPLTVSFNLPVRPMHFITSEQPSPFKIAHNMQEPNALARTKRYPTSLDKRTGENPEAPRKTQ